MISVFCVIMTEVVFQTIPVYIQLAVSQSALMDAAIARIANYSVQ